MAAEKGELTIMFGSPSPMATRLAMPLLQMMAREGGVIECGGSGTGVGVKVCNKWVFSRDQFFAKELRSGKPCISLESNSSIGGPCLGTFAQH